jgi:hypothetical protein
MWRIIVFIAKSSGKITPKSALFKEELLFPGEQ